MTAVPKRQSWIKGDPKLQITPEVDLPGSGEVMDLEKFLQVEVAVIDRRNYKEERGITIKGLLEKYS